MPNVESDTTDSKRQLRSLIKKQEPSTLLVWEWNACSTHHTAAENVPVSGTAFVAMQLLPAGMECASNHITEWSFLAKVIRSMWHLLAPHGTCLLNYHSEFDSWTPATAKQNKTLPCVVVTLASSPLPTLNKAQSTAVRDYFSIRAREEERH